MIVLDCDKNTYLNGGWCLSLFIRNITRMNVVSRIIFLHVWVVILSNAQFVPESDSYQDDLSFLDVAVDRGENARLCVCSQNFFSFTIPFFPGPVDENGISC